MQRIRKQGLYNWRYFRGIGFAGLAAMVIGSGCQTKDSAEQIQPGNISISDQLPWSVRMADSEMYRRGDSLEYNKDNRRSNWNYQTGLFLKALLDVWSVNGNAKYFDYVKKVIDSFVREDGTIETYHLQDFNLDNICPGRVLLVLYRETKNERYLKAARLLRKQLSEQPRTKSGGFWHKKVYPWQMWLDGIYMAAPFYAEYSKTFGQPDGYEDVINQILLIDVHTRDPKTGLRYHGWDESCGQKWANPETGCSPNFWGRGVGWYAMALVDVLEILPDDFPRREQIRFILNDLVKAVVKYQDADRGVWYQVMDQDGRKGNYFEASASSMFVYTLAKSLHLNLIDSTYWPAAVKGYQGLLDNFVVTSAGGVVGLTRICNVAGLGGNPYRDGSYEYYIKEPVVSNDLKGVAPFIMASLQMEKPK